MEKLQYLLKNYKHFLAEGILLLLSIIITVISVGLYFMNSNAKAPVQIPQNTSSEPLEQVPNNKIIIDISGAVMKPDSYELASTARLKDALNTAGGLSEIADKEFFYRNYNLAKGIKDQEKIYIPSLLEVATGIFKESYRLIDFNDSLQAPVEDNKSERISINQASIEELDTLPGVGKTTAEKINENRPYASIEDLSTNSVVGKALFEKIKDLIEL